MTTASIGTDFAIVAPHSTEHSLIVTGELEGDKASHAAALLVSCNDLFLNQQYMIIAYVPPCPRFVLTRPAPSAHPHSPPLLRPFPARSAPCILTLLEIARFIKVRGFLQHLRTPAEVFVPQSLAALGKSEERRRRRRSERRRARREEEEDEKALLSV